MSDPLSMQRRQCPIHNDTMFIVYNVENWSTMVSLQK